MHNELAMASYLISSRGSASRDLAIEGQPQDDLLPSFYHEAPDDVFEFELIVLKCLRYMMLEVYDDIWGMGGLNSFRLANNRLKQVIESCTTRLTNRQEEDGPDLLPIPIIQRCRRIHDR